VTIAAPAPPEQHAAPAAPRAARWPRLIIPAVALGLYLLAASLLLVRLGQHPAFAYNWEPYAAYGLFAFRDHPTFAILKATEGLITDSSASPLVILPGWLAFQIGGVGLLSLRIATALLAAAAVPLLWWTGRHFVGPWPAFLAALLLALSPVYLLYGRTAILVGLSLVPALATIEALRRVLHHPGDRRWLLALQALLILGVYSYAPIRFLWPIALAFLALPALGRPAQWPTLRRAFFVTLLVPWLAISIISLRDPATALALYFQGRGEQVFGLSFKSSQYGAYLRPDPADPHPGPPQGNAVTLAARLIAQNTGDLANLLLDRHTLPALTDSTSAHGRLYPAFLAPFLALGLLVAALGARRRLEDRLLLAFSAAWTLPLILTSKVHIGRLIFFLPLLCLLVASGATRPIQWLAERLATRLNPRHAARSGILAAALVAVLLLPAVAAATWRDYHESPPLPAEAAIATALRATATAHPPGVALLLHADQGDDPTKGIGEATEVASLLLSLDPLYRFISLYSPDTRPDPTGPATLIPLYYGNLLAHLDDPRLPSDVTYYVTQAALAQFQSRYAARRNTCGDPRFVVLP
jgi:4-amino-4-deoxy-L-arabinose transferase-like glycosyltransferase